MVIFGGYSMSTFNYFGDTWALSLIGTPTWSPVLSRSRPHPAAPRSLDGSRPLRRSAGGLRRLERRTAQRCIWQPRWERIRRGPGSLRRGLRRHRVSCIPESTIRSVSDCWSSGIRRRIRQRRVGALPDGIANLDRDPPDGAGSGRAGRDHHDLRSGARPHGLFRGWDGTQYLDDVWALSLSGEPSWERLDGDPQLTDPPRVVITSRSTIRSSIAW